MFLDESGFMLQPVCRCTWAPRGRTAILRQWDRHDRLTTVSALTIAPQRHRYGLYWAAYPHNIRNAQVLRFLQALRRHLPRGFTLIWDRNRPHRAQRVHAWLARQRRIVVEWLPPYAPELNPVEQVWGHTKYGDLANHTPDSLPELADAVLRAGPHPRPRRVRARRRKTRSGSPVGSISTASSAATRSTSAIRSGCASSLGQVSRVSNS